MNVIKQSKWKTIRVFISSTFRDMQAERDYLVRFVFPKLRQELLKQRIHLVDVDLRWGVTSDQEAFELCMHEIDRCHPRFICLLGGRYGWIPPPKRISNKIFETILSDSSAAGILTNDERNSLKLLYSSVQREGFYQLIDKPRTTKEVKVYFEQGEIAVLVLQRAGISEANRSITAAEIHHGVFDRLQKPAFRYFYFREETVTNSIPEPAARDYSEPVKSRSSQLLENLKQYIRNPETLGSVLVSPDQVAELPLQWHDYSCKWDNITNRIRELKSFGLLVCKDLLESIKAEFEEQLTDKPDEFEEEVSAMDLFVENSTERFVLGGRKTIMDELISHTSGTDINGYLCVTGPPGSGKSALIAKFSQQETLNNNSILLIRHFIGASSGSTDIRRTIQRICYELKKGCENIKDDIPDDVERLVLTFKDFLEKACKEKRVIILLDAVNQFDSYANRGSLHWLPEHLPFNTRIILSAPECPVQDGLNCQFLAQKIPLKPLLSVDREAIVGLFEERYRKKFEVIQRDALLAKTDACVPLYLTTALEELRTLGTYEEITHRISTLPPTTLELFTWILNRLKEDDGFRDANGSLVGHYLVSRFAALLGASRYGLSQKELIDLLEPEDPLGNVAALLQLLRPYLMLRGELIDFYHGQFRTAACEMALSNPSEKADTHQTLALYFKRTADPENNGSWSAIGADEDQFPAVHALGEVSFHAYQFAKESANPSILFLLANDGEFRKKLFEHSGSPRLTVELMGYSLEVSAGITDLVQLVHFTMIRTSFISSMARSYLVRLPQVVKYDGVDRVELARAMIRLIPRPDHKRIGLLMMSWMLCFDPIRKLLVNELIREAASIVAPVDACQSALLLEIISRLYQEEYVEVTAILNIIPLSPIREKYRTLWATGHAKVHELSERLSLASPSNMPIPLTGMEEFQNIHEFATSYGPLFSRVRTQASFNAIEIKMCKAFGMNGAAGGYFLMACNQIQSGSTRMAETQITRGIYICLASDQPPYRTLAAMVNVFGNLGESDMANEQEARVRTLDKMADLKAHTPDEKGQLEDQRREMMISIDSLAETWRAPGSRDLFQLGIRNRKIKDVITEHTDVLFLISNARLLLAEGNFTQLSNLLVEILAAIPKSPVDQQSVLYFTSYCLARACKDEVSMQNSVATLTKIGIHPESLCTGSANSDSNSMQLEDPTSKMNLSTEESQRMAHAVSILSIADPRCIATIALSLRKCGNNHGLFELLWRATYQGFPMSKLDPILCELVQFPGLNASELRKISDEILDKRSNLPIPTGLGLYYYSGIMLNSAWAGGVLMASGISSDISQGITLLFLSGILIVTGAIGAFGDLFIWKFSGLLKRPEKSRRILTQMGVSIGVYWLASFLIQRHLPSQILQSQVVTIGIIIGLACLFTLMLLLRKQIFNRWDRKSITLGTAIAGLLGVIGWWAGKNWFKDETSQYLLTGLFITGSFAVSFALNILPKHLVCLRYFGQRGNK